MHIAGLLVAVAIGYWVLERAERHRTMQMKRIGRIVAGFIIIVGMVGVGCKLVGVSSGKYGRGYCAKKAGWSCPYHQGSSTDGPSTNWQTK